jgi:L-asparaginase
MDRIRCSAAALLFVIASALLPAEPTVVPGLVMTGTGVRTKTIPLAVTDATGTVRDDILPGVLIIERVTWSPDDPVRDGAVEFELLLAAARLLRDHPLAGLVAVGNRHGILCPRGETSARRVVHLGVPVVRLADSGKVASTPDDLLISGGTLSPTEARALLRQCLVRHGALPPAHNPERPTAKELAAIRTRLAAYQRDFDAYLAARDPRNHLVVASR